LTSSISSLDLFFFEEPFSKNAPFPLEAILKLMYHNAY